MVSLTEEIGFSVVFRNSGVNQLVKSIIGFTNMQAGSGFETFVELRRIGVIIY
jgi:hypothetical protein